MTTQMDKVLTCPTLPSLPGVAMKVLDLTRDRNVSINALGEAVQMDPALSTKVLKTVNSSYYGLATPCPSITRAMSMLGLNTVKSIVLGFSLVDFTKSLAGAASGFDLPAYWRRAVYSAAAARSIAKQTRRCEAEEAFVAALVADIGVLASLAALRQEYLEALKEAPQDHDEVLALERANLGFDHAMVGKELGSRWRLPPMLVAAIAHHHNEASCVPAYADLVRCVVLGRLAADTLTYADNKRKLGSFLVKSGEWFSLSREDARAMIEQTSQGASELSKLLDLKTGAAPDVESILSEAKDQMVMTQVELQRQNEALTRQTITDALTGAFNRAHFDQELGRLSNEANASSPMGVLFMDADKFKSVNDTHGHAAGDAVLKELSSRVMASVGNAGVVCRYGGEEFAVLLPGTNLERAKALGEAVRASVEGAPFDLSAHGAGLPTLRVTVSVGVSVFEAAEGTTGASAVASADSAVYGAKKSGRNKVCVCVVGGQVMNLDGSVVEVLEGGVSAGGGATSAGVSGSAHGSAQAGAAVQRAAAQAPLQVGPHAGLQAVPQVGASKPSPAGHAQASLGLSPKPASKAGSGKPVVLIVEDDPMAAKLMELLFAKRAELQVHVVDSGEAAMQYLTTPGRSVPHVVISDMNLPGITGTNLARMIRVKLQRQAPPVIIVTVGSDERTKSMAQNGGAALFLNKADMCSNFELAFEQIKGAIARHSSVQQLAA